MSDRQPLTSNRIPKAFLPFYFLVSLSLLPTEIKARFLQTSIDLDDKNASIDLAFEVCKEFDLSLSEAKDEAQKIAKKTSRWKKVAQNLKVRQQEIDFMSSAFEHEDLKKALKPRSTY